jgi:4-hydroxybenzoyl-CoA thioesterase
MSTSPAVIHRFERPLTVRFSHCDPAGIVFFPRYLVMFNDFVETWVTEGLGVPYTALVATRRVGLPSVSLNCQFTAISRMGDEVTLGVSVEKIGNSSIRLNLGCRQGDEQRVQVQQVLVTTDLNTHRAIPIPDDLRRAMTAFQQD